jgi:hypothetical protein
VLEGEPVSPQKTRTACTESWRDVNANDACEEWTDLFHDADNNQQFTKVLYFVDLDGNGARRIGLVDKYVVGLWDGSLRSDKVEEQAPKKPPATPKPKPDPVEPKPKPEQPKPKPNPDDPRPKPADPQPKPDDPQPKPKPKPDDPKPAPEEEPPPDEF